MIRALATYTQACTIFQLLAHRTWNDLEDGHKLGLPISEESITDFLLLDLKRALPNNIFIRKFSKLEEGKTTGAGWEWWFVGRGCGFGMRIQAKRLAGTGRYEGLRKQAGKKSGVQQVDLLIQDAVTAKLYPAYCFYNFSQGGSGLLPAWNCRSFPPDRRLFGCAVADAMTVNGLVSRGQDDFQSVSKYCLPWSCLVCCRGFVTNPDDSLADRIRSLVARVLVGAEGVPAQNEMPVPQVIERRDWPEYVGAILEGTEVIITERPENRDVDGILVVRID